MVRYLKTYDSMAEKKSCPLLDKCKTTNNPPPMKHPLLFLICLLSLAVPVMAAASGQDLLLFYSNDVQGETAPCGCQANQLGGLPKKGFQLKAIAQQKAGYPHLALDAGNLLFKHDHIVPGQEEQEEMTAAAIVEAYNLIGYTAVGIGSRDLIAGVPYLLTLRDKAKFAWLSANLVAKSTKQPLFKPSITRTFGTVKVSILALTGARALPETDEATILPWDQVLPGLIEQVASKHDLVILLSNLSVADNQRIAETYDRIHLIIQSGATAEASSQGPINNTVLVSAAPQGRGIGIMEINWQAGGRWGDKKGEALVKRKADLDRLLWQLGKYQQNTLREQPDQLKAYHALRTREQELRGEIKRLAKEVGQHQPEEVEPASYANRFMAMEETLPDQPEILAVTDRLDRALNQLGRQKAKAPVPVDPLYLGAQGCGPCHPSQLAAWQQTPHARAYKTLADNDQQFNTNCLPCHVTGVTMDRANDALSVPENRRGVGCETCHGPGRRHGENPAGPPLTRKPSPEVCRGCHLPPNDTSFDYERNIKMVH